MGKWTMLIVFATVAVGIALTAKASFVSASSGQTTTCNSCHSISSSLNINATPATTTVLPGESFRVDISWSGSSNGVRTEINWPNTQSNTLFGPAPRIPFSSSSNSASGTTSSILTAPATPGNYTVRIFIARANPFDTIYTDVNVTVAAAPVNTAPVLNTIGNRTVTAGQPLQFTVSGSDPDGDSLTYSATGLPSGAGFNPATRTFDWTPSSAGTYNMTFTVSDGSLSDSETISITVSNPAPVNRAPVLNTVGNRTVTAGQPLQFTVSGSDPDGDSLTYSATGLPSGAGFSPATGVFSWTPSSASTYNVTFAVSDGSFSDSETISITVTNPAPVNRAPVLNAIGNRTVTTGQSLQFTVSGSDPDGDSLTYSATGLPSGAGFSPATGVFSWTPSSAGTYNVSFMISDGSLSDSETISITVNNSSENSPGVNSPPILNPVGDKIAQPGKLLTFTISASDPDGDALSFQGFDLPPGASFNSNTGTFAWIPGPAKEDDERDREYDEVDEVSGENKSVYNVLFRVSDGSLTDSEYVSITIAEETPNRPPVLTPVNNRTVSVGELLQFTVSAVDPDADLLSYSVSNLPSGASFNAATRTFFWTPSSPGTYSGIRFTVSDGLLTDSDTMTITVTIASSDVNNAPVINPPGNRTVTKGQLLQFTVSATDPDGDTLSYTASNLPAGAVFDQSNRTFTWMPSSAGIYANITFSVSDGSLVDADTMSITVTDPADTTNAAPVLNPVGERTATAGQLIQFTLYATDIDGDTLSYTASNLPAGAVFDQSNRTFTWMPSSAGIYANITFNVSDGLLTDSESITIVVNSASNTAPVLADIVDKKVKVDHVLQFVVTAFDFDGDELTFSAINLPSGASFNPLTGVFYWKPKFPGSYNNVLFSVSDGILTDSKTIDIIAVDPNSAPVLGDIGNKKITAGQTFRFSLSATDPDGDSLTYSGSNLPAGASLNPASGEFNWTPDSPGTYPYINFMVTDGSLTDSESIAITVTPAADDAPVLNPIGNKSVPAGESIQFTVSANDPDGDDLTYSVNNLPEGADFNPETGVFSWHPESAGVYTGITFKVTDGESIDSEVISIVVEVGDVMGPAIQDTTCNKVGPGEIIIRWLTDEPSTSQVEYWASPHQLSDLDTSYLTEHEVRLTGLKPGTVYRYKAISEDRNGNISESREYNFTTTGDFTVSELEITPAIAAPGDEISVKAMVTNNMDIEGSYELEMKIGGITFGTRNVRLSPGEQKKVEFVTTRYTTGTAVVDVNGITASLEINPLAAKTTNRLLPGIAIGGLVLLITALMVRLRFLRRRSKHHNSIPVFLR